MGYNPRNIIDHHILALGTGHRLELERKFRLPRISKQYSLDVSGCILFRRL